MFTQAHPARTKATHRMKRTPKLDKVGFVTPVSVVVFFFAYV